MTCGRQSVAVVGCGVIGLTSAVRILERDPGVQVTVIADSFTPCNTTDGAAGILFPVFLGDTPIHLIRKWFGITFKRFEELRHSNLSSELGIFKFQGYTITDKAIEQDPYLKDQIFEYRRMTEEELGKFPVSPQDGYVYSSIIAQGKGFMPWLMRRFCSLGGMLVKRMVNSLRELAFDYDVVVNCTALRAKELVNDSLMYPVRGHMIKVKAPWLKNVLTYENTEDKRCQRFRGVFPQTNGECWLAGTAQIGDYNTKATVEDTLAILKSTTELVPSLKGRHVGGGDSVNNGYNVIAFKDATIVDTWVGLRPARKAVRLEKEIMTFKDADHGKDIQVNVVHNYGHGGAGISLSFGCAEDCCDLVFEFLATKPRSRYHHSKL